MGDGAACAVRDRVDRDPTETLRCAGITFVSRLGSWLDDHVVTSRSVNVERLFKLYT